MNKLTILGSGAAPGVPSLACGWGACNPNNPKNRRKRTTVYLEFGETKILIDTSPDLRMQLLEADIRRLDGIVYTHAHADHLHGIDDLREINRISGKSLDVYAKAETAAAIRARFPYLLALKQKPNDPEYRASIVLNEIENEKPFYIGNVSVTPLALEGHAIVSNGYMFNDGELVYIADCMNIAQSSLDLIKGKAKTLVMPLTNIRPQPFHMGLEKLLEYVRVIEPERTIINHMAVECDYDHVNALTPGNVTPAYDGMTVEL
jgi:phosphoribosyl 1,2-cyclic phosphate phosphodiesterase